MTNSEIGIAKNRKDDLNFPKKKEKWIEFTVNIVVLCLICNTPLFLGQYFSSCSWFAFNGLGTGVLILWLHKINKNNEQLAQKKQFVFRFWYFSVIVFFLFEKGHLCLVFILLFLYSDIFLHHFPDYFFYFK